MTEKNFVQYCELWLNSAPKFAQLSSIFNGTNESYQNSANFGQYWTIFPSDFNNIYLKYVGHSQNLMRNHEMLWEFTKVYVSLWNFMISHETNEIFLVKSFTFIYFCSFVLYFVDFCFRYFFISKYDCRILVLIGQFRHFELSNLPIVKVKKVHNCRYLVIMLNVIRQSYVMLNVVAPLVF